MQQLARKFTREEIIPNAAHYDKTGEVRKMIDNFGGVAREARSNLGICIELSNLVSMANCEKSSCTWFDEYTHSNQIWFVDFSIRFLKNCFVYLGGLGLGILDSCVVTEELAYG